MGLLEKRFFGVQKLVQRIPLCGASAVLKVVKSKTNFAPRRGGVHSNLTKKMVAAPPKAERNKIEEYVSFDHRNSRENIL